MKYAALFLLSLPAFAQIATRPTPAAAAMPPNAGGAMRVAPKPMKMKIPLANLVALERGFDGKLAGIADTSGPIDMLGATRGIFLDGYGVVFTTEMGLIVTPAVTAFNQTITDAQKNRVHSAKVTRLPLLKKVMTEMVREVAGTLAQVGETQQIVVAVRLDYLNWENTAGLPGLLVAKADRRSAMAGNIQFEEQ